MCWIPTFSCIRAEFLSSILEAVPSLPSRSLFAEFLVVIWSLTNCRCLTMCKSRGCLALSEGCECQMWWYSLLAQCCLEGCSHCPYSRFWVPRSYWKRVFSPHWVLSLGYSNWRWHAHLFVVSVSGVLWSDPKALRARMADTLPLSHTSSLCFWSILFCVLYAASVESFRKQHRLSDVTWVSCFCVCVSSLKFIVTSFSTQTVSLKLMVLSFVANCYLVSLHKLIKITFNQIW